MADVIELRDGNLITPFHIYDALDAVEEYCGTELRQYLEVYFLDDEEEEIDLDDHYITVLGSIGDVASEAERYLSKRKYQVARECLQRIKAMTQREVQKYGKESI